MKKSLKIVAILIILAVLFAFFIKGNDDVVIDVADGESFSSVAMRLKDGGVIKSAFLFTRYAIIKGADTEFKPGAHTFNQSMNYDEIIMELKTSVAGFNTCRLTIAEGTEIYNVAKKVAENFNITEEEFLETAVVGNFSYPFLSTKGADESLEGYLYPDTYEFFASATAHDIIKKMLDRFSDVWVEEFDKRAAELSLTRDEVLILASIIEREAASVDEMGKVSSVFHNRLKINMPLQSCATVQYILKERKDVLSVADTKIDSPYNTYRFYGLPVGAIASPSESAIKAALYPEDTDYYFFRAVDGVTLFSKTLNEHNSK